ncbi:hypothetical protein V2J09_011978 [Rumex salicifolius]
MDVAECYLDGNADAVEFCPHIGFENILAASTYTLHENADKPTRLGSISLFDVDAEGRRLELIHRVESAGIFDIKWNPVETGNALGPLLAQADADGYLRIHGVEESEAREEVPGKCLRERDSIQVSSSMCLYVDWHPSATSLSVGLSVGSVSIISLSDSHLNLERTWKAHDFELWTTCFDVHQPQLVYTGSDDCRFSCWDLRQCAPSPAFQNSKAHTMGVCCIVKSPYDSNLLLTGSYDEYLRVWDMRSISKPVNETSVCLGGGVWRIKYHPSEPELVLAACMHNGFAIVEIDDEKKLQVKETYTKHGSLAYGADWQRGQSNHHRKNVTVATCSFYDKMLRLWIPQSDNL